MPSRNERPLFADLSDQIAALAGDVRDMAQARWELARLELQADLHSALRLAIAWGVSVLFALTALPLFLVYLAELLDGCAGIQCDRWLLIFAGGLLLLAIAGSYLAWRRFLRKFIGLRETIEEFREDIVWLHDAAGRGKDA